MTTSINAVQPEPVFGFRRPEQSASGEQPDGDLDHADQEQADESEQADLASRSGDEPALSVAEELLAHRQEYRDRDEVLHVGEAAFEEERDRDVRAQNGAHSHSPGRAECCRGRGESGDDCGGHADVAVGGEVASPIPVGVAARPEEERCTEFARQLTADRDDGRVLGSQAPFAPADREGKNDDDRNILTRRQSEEPPRDESPPLAFLQGRNSVGDVVEPRVGTDVIPQGAGRDPDDGDGEPRRSR